MRARARVVLVFLAAGVWGALVAADLTPSARTAWEDYTRKADAQAEARIRAGRSLRPSEAPGADEILSVPMSDRGAVPISGGLIHDWFGRAFIPGARIEDVFAVLHDYDRYKDYFAPTVAGSRALSRTDSAQQFSMLLHHKALFVDAAVRGEYEARDFEVNDRLWYNIAGTTRMQEMENYGKRDERLLPPDQGSGFLWRLHSIARYEERDGGVDVQVEAMGLTRDIPPSLRWLVGPLAARLSRDSVITSLRQTRDAVEARPAVISAARMPLPAKALRRGRYR